MQLLPGVNRITFPSGCYVLSLTLVMRYAEAIIVEVSIVDPP